MPVRSLACVLAAVLLAIASLSARAAETHAYVVTTDFSTGGLSSIDLATRAVARDVATVYSDARARWSGGLLYVLNRLGQDNLQVIDPAAGFTTVRQFSLGNGSNPSDIIVVSPHKAYVSLYQRAEILIVDPTTGVSLGGIDLAPFADADGIPEADHMARFGRWLFVSLERLDETHVFVPTDTSLVAVIDAGADTVVDVNPALPGKQAIVLSRTNPVTAFAWDPVERVFYLGCAGSYRATDGGIVKIDPATMRDLGVVATEAALGGDIAHIEWHTATHGYAIVTDADFNASLVTWNPSTGAKLATIFGPSSGLADCARDDQGELYVCDNSFSTPGIRVFSTATDLPIAGPLDTGLPPFQVLFDALTPDVLDVPPAVAASPLSNPAPNPARGGVAFRLALDHDADAAVEAFDLGGRRVRTIERGRTSAGAHELRWDLRDDSGRIVAPGVYLVRLRSEARTIVRRVSVVE